jgi:hypothetical protein
MTAHPERRILLDEMVAKACVSRRGGSRSTATQNR